MAIFGLDPDDIASMGDPLFPRLMNALLWAEYSYLGVSPGNIAEHWRRYTGDHGIDHGGTLEIVPNVERSRWIPSSDAVWQYKAGGHLDRPT